MHVSIHLLIVIIRNMLSVSLGPRVITLSCAHFITFLKLVQFSHFVKYYYTKKSDYRVKECDSQWLKFFKFHSFCYWWFLKKLQKYIFEVNDTFKHLITFKHKEVVETSDWILSKEVFETSHKYTPLFLISCWCQSSAIFWKWISIG